MHYCMSWNAIRFDWNRARAFLVAAEEGSLSAAARALGVAQPTLGRQVEQLDEVLESIVVGQPWDNDVRVVLFVKLRDEATLDEDLENRIRVQIRTNTTPRHVPAKIIQVADIPRTKSGKITELAVRNVICGRPVKNREALANPEALDLYQDLPQLSD